MDKMQKFKGERDRQTIRRRNVVTKNGHQITVRGCPRITQSLETLMPFVEVQYVTLLSKTGK